MGLFFNKKKKEEAGKDYCLFCGMDLVNGVCSRCGREAKPMVGFDVFSFKPVPTSVAAELGEQKKSLLGNDLLTVQEMIQSGNLFMADILFDSTTFDTHEFGERDPFFDNTEYEHYVQFSTPDGTPCSKCCAIDSDDFAMVEELLSHGQREGWLLKGIYKKKEYYYAIAPGEERLGSLLRDRVAQSMMYHGTEYENRRPAPKGVRDSLEFRHVISTSWDDAQ